MDHATTVHIFWPLDARAEIDTRPVIDVLLARGVRVALPVVTRHADGSPQLEQRLYAPGALGPGAFGVLEPLDTPFLPGHEVDVAIVPALAASRDGFRLGYGGGYYDSFLDGLDTTVVCPVFDVCLVDALPREPHDERVDIVVTESRLVRPART
jgi:5-formyltetrahydrofolate cyclo-ligase